jgi:hypothetical protein
MTWVRLDDKFYQHPKVMGLSDKAYRCHVNGLCFSAQYDLDGEIPATALASLRGTPKVAAELVEARLWDTTSRGGWVIHDYLVYNRSKLQVEEARAKKADAGRRGASHRWNQPDAIASAIAHGIAEEMPPVPNPSPTNVVDQAKALRKPVDADFLKDLAGEFPTLDVAEVYAKAQNRKTWDGYKDKRRALREHCGYALDRQRSAREPMAVPRQIFKEEGIFAGLD